MNTKRKLAAIPAGILCALIASHAAPIQAADSFVDAFKQGKGGLKFRYRLENVDQDNYEKDATASTLNSLSDSLDKEQFLRIHRSLIVNKFYIKSCRYNSNNEYKFHLKNGEQLISSRSYKSLISEYLSSVE